MATNFFIEFRLHGYTRSYAKWVKARAHNKAKRLGVKGLRLEREVPHITLFGPAKTNNIRRVVSELKRIGHKYALVPFTIDGFSRFDNRASKVIYLDVVPSPKLEHFRWELAQSLLNKKDKISITDSPFDDGERFKFHSTIKKFTNIGEDKFNELCKYLDKSCRLKDYEQYRNQHKVSMLDKFLNFMKKHLLEQEDEDQDISQHLLRITVLGKSRRIRCEYDVVRKVLLNRRQALSRYWWEKTISRFRELQRQ